MGLVNRGDVWWVNLDPTIGTEINKTRPALVISPDDMNAVLPRVMVAPLTSKEQKLGCRPELMFQGRNVHILLDQLRCIDKHRLVSRMGSIQPAFWHDTLLEMLE